ncbi:MAG: VWA domain-containing protein [Pseudomonadota bacterium]
MRKTSTCPEDPLSGLAVADPKLAEKVEAGLKQKTDPVSQENIALLVEESIWGLSRETAFGHAIAMGYLDLIESANRETLEKYRDMVRETGKIGPALGWIMATSLVPVLTHGDEAFLERFRHVADVMQQKGTYTLKNPFETLSLLLKAKDIDGGTAYLDLLRETFSQELSYARCQHFSYTLPRAVLDFPKSKRVWQIEQLRRVVQTDFRLADAFLEGLKKGLDLLSKEALIRFVSLGLNKPERDRKRAARFLSLESKLGADTFSDMQVTVPLSQVQHRLNRYLRARTGLAISICPLSSLPESRFTARGDMPVVISDGKFIYLPDEIRVFDRKSENINLYKCLTRLESGCYEFNTFDFDRERALERCRMHPEIQDLDIACRNGKNLSDLDSFFLFFPESRLASDLFTVFEHGRLRLKMSRWYPGIVRDTLPVIEQEAIRIFQKDDPGEAIFLLYVWIALGAGSMTKFDFKPEIVKRVAFITDRFEKHIREDTAVEACAELVVLTYRDMSNLLTKTSDPGSAGDFYRPLKTPFDRRVRPELFYETYRHFDRVAESIKAKLEEKGFSVYKSDVRKRLIVQDGAISHGDIQEILLIPQRDTSGVPDRRETPFDVSWLDLSGVLGQAGNVWLENADVDGTVFWYKEWDRNLGDYLLSHVRVLDRKVAGRSGDFYVKTLADHRGLVKRIRRAFEQLKPEGLKHLRQWVDGDEFDYRALIDFAVEKKAGWIPSDRLYIKRIKQHRDVAVLLLVDCSRSTSNSVSGSEKRVLDVEKEAVVLFCEALEVVDDAYAVAGFSGTGRLGVDYLRVKDFDEEMNHDIRMRIDAVTPLRSTRMGAAIRHATTLLERVSSKVRLLIILSDGFPNDLEYKQDYAIADTRRAIFEARSKNIYAHAITVYSPGDSRLDDLYGNGYYNVISDVRELPDKLLRIYGTLTRN